MIFSGGKVQWIVGINSLRSCVAGKVFWDLYNICAVWYCEYLPNPKSQKILCDLLLYVASSFRCTDLGVKKMVLMI